MNQDPLSLDDFMESELAEDIQDSAALMVAYYEYLKEFYEALIDVLEMTGLDYDDIEDIYESPIAVKAGWICVTLAAHVIIYLTMSGIIFQ